MVMLSYIHCRLRGLIAGTGGAVATEYVFLIAFVAIAMAFGAVIYGQALIDFFNALAQALEAQPANLPPAE